MSPFCLTPKTIAHYCVCASLFLAPTPFLAIIQLSFGQQILYVTDELIMKLLYPDPNTNCWASNGVSKSGHVTSLDWTHKGHHPRIIKPLACSGRAGKGL